MRLLASMLLRLPILFCAGVCVHGGGRVPKSFAYALMHAYLAAAPPRCPLPPYLNLPHNLCMCEIWRHIAFLPLGALCRHLLYVAYVSVRARVCVSLKNTKISCNI